MCPRSDWRLDRCPGGYNTDVLLARIDAKWKKWVSGVLSLFNQNHSGIRRLAPFLFPFFRPECTWANHIYTSVLVGLNFDSACRVVVTCHAACSTSQWSTPSGAYHNPIRWICRDVQLSYVSDRSRRLRLWLLTGGDARHYRKSPNVASAAFGPKRSPLGESYNH